MTLTLLLLVAAIVIVLCVVLNNVSNKIGIPMLLAFILLGMAFGSDGIVKVRQLRFYREHLYRGPDIHHVLRRFRHPVERG